jgi:tetratricopeptide (TPR) repeat protein
MLERAIALDPKLAGPHDYLAQRAEEKDQNAEALDHYRQAAALSPGDERIAYRLAFAYKRAGDEVMFQKGIRRFRALHEKANQSSIQAAEQLQRIDSTK